VRTIARTDFGHGRTRNLAAGDARGELLVFLSQDAVPADRAFIARLVAAFDDPRTAGAYARVLPHDDDDPLTRRTVLDQLEASPEPRAWDLDGGGELAGLEPEVRAAELRFNNVASAIRASVLRALPFPDVPFGEDFGWAARALEAGHRIRYVPAAVVLHAHRYGPREAFQRYRTDAAFHREVHGHRVRPDLVSALRGLLYEWRADLRFLTGPGAWQHTGPEVLLALVRSPLLRGAQVAGQYAGSRGLGGPTAFDFEAFERIG
jgi:rhamnosyltransferase